MHEVYCTTIPFLTILSACSLGTIIIKKIKVLSVIRLELWFHQNLGKLIFFSFQHQQLLAGLI